MFLADGVSVGVLASEQRIYSQPTVNLAMTNLSQQYALQNSCFLIAKSSRFSSGMSSGRLNRSAGMPSSINIRIAIPENNQPV